MRSRQDKDLKVRNTTYFKKTTEKLLKSKSAEVIYPVTSMIQIETTPRELRPVKVFNMNDDCPIVKGVCDTCQIMKG